MKIISGLMGLIIFLLALAFVLSNRQTTTLSLWPFDIKIDAPLYLLSLGTLLFGIALGALLAWATLLPHRLATRRLKKDMMRLQEKLSDLQQTVLPPRGTKALSSARRASRLWGRFS